MSLGSNEKESDNLLGIKREHEGEIEYHGFVDKDESKLSIKKETSNKLESAEKEPIPTPGPLIPESPSIKKTLSNCHLCKKGDSPFSMLTCTNLNCARSFCFPCSKKCYSPNKEAYRKVKKSAEERSKWVCFVCNEACTCGTCCFPNKRNLNIITIPNIGFCRQGEGEIQEIHKSSVDSIPINHDTSNSENQTNKKKCAACNKSDVDLICFKKIEDFLNYLKNAFDKKQGLIKNEPSFEQNRVSFFEVYPLLSKIGGLALKEIKYLCRVCLVSKSNEFDGFKNLYKLLEIDNILHPPSNITIVKTEEPLQIPQTYSSQKEKEINENAKIVKANLEPLQSQNIPQKKEDTFILNQMSDNKQDKGKPPDQCQQFENSLNFLLGNIGQGSNNKVNSKPFELTQQANSLANLQANLMNNITTAPGGNMPSLASNFSKIAESITNFNNQNLQQNMNVFSNVNQLTGILSNLISDPSINPENKDDHGVVGENRKTGEEEKKDDNTNNITNIIMNFEQNKNHPLISYMVNILDDLKKQINSIQYYSQMQKLFIAYIFKNLEVFMEQVSNHQLLNECQKSTLLGNFPQMHGGLPMQMNQLNQIGQAMMGMNLPQQGVNLQDLNMLKKMPQDDTKQYQTNQMEMLRSTGTNQGAKSNIQGPGKEVKIGQNMYGSGTTTIQSGTLPQMGAMNQMNQMNQINQMNQLNQMNMNSLIMEQLMKGKIGGGASQQGMQNSQVSSQSGNLNPYLLGMLSNSNSMPPMNTPMPNPLLLAMQGNPNLAGLLGNVGGMQGTNVGGMMGMQNLLAQQLGMPNQNQNFMQQSNKFINTPQSNQFPSVYSLNPNQNQGQSKQQVIPGMPNMGHMFMPGGNPNSYNLMNLLSTQQNEVMMGGLHGMQNMYNPGEMESQGDMKEKMKPRDGNNEQSQERGQDYMMLGNIGNLSNLNQEQLMQLQMYLSHGGNANAQNKSKGRDYYD